MRRTDLLDDTSCYQFELKVRKEVDHRTIETGFDTFRARKVRTTEYIRASHKWIGTVIGPSTIHPVVVSPDQFAEGSCSCGAETVLCAHQIALYLSYVNTYKNGFTARDAFERMMDVQPSPLIATFDASSITPVFPKLEPRDWYADMTAKYGDVYKSCRQSLHGLQNVLSSLKSSSRDWPHTLRTLYWIQAIQFVVEQAELALSSTDSFLRYYYELPFSRVVEPWTSQLLELIDSLRLDEMVATEREGWDAIGRFYEGIKKFDLPSLHPIDSLYYAYLHKSSEDEGLFAQLEQRLKQRAALELDTVEALFLQKALALIHVLRGQDEAALAMFSKLEFNAIAPTVAECALQRLNEGKFEALEPYMLYLFEPIARGVRTKAQANFFAMCRLAAEHQPQQSRWEQMLIDCLPYSSTSLGEHWLEHGNYERWADLQQLMGNTVNELDQAHVRQVLKAAPAVLLPMYVQAIHASVELRNRQGYKMAIRLMKKAQKVYEAAQLSAQWSALVADITTRYSRLRAFQEELARGKIG